MYIFEKNFTLGDWAICDYTEAALKQLEIFPLVPDNRKRGGNKQYTDISKRSVQNIFIE